MRPPGKWKACLIVCAFLGGCAQPFSDYQSARLVGKGEFELTASYSSVSFSNDGEADKVQDDIGVQMASGTGDRTDIRIRFERIEADDADVDGVNVLGFGPKFGVVENNLALFLPVGFAFGGGIETSETWQTHPTILLTGPLTDNLEVNGSGKVLIPLNADGGDNLVAFNIGLGISPDLSRWALRPEFGMLFNPGEDGHFYHLGLGLTASSRALR